ncbi:sigma-70 family RNA polymerase sigma factor [Streptomyces californicus]
MAPLPPKPVPPLSSLSSTILPRQLAAFHDTHRLVFIKYVRSRGVLGEDAEDVVSQAFLTLYRAGQSFLQADNAAAFAFKVLRDVTADHFRRCDRRPRTRELPDAFEGGTGVDGGIEAVICRIDVERALQRLSPRQADCLRLRLLLDVPRQQIARYLGISDSAVSSHIFAGRQALALHLTGYQPQMVTGGGQE